MKLTESELQRLRDLSADAAVFGLSPEEATELKQLQERLASAGPHAEDASASEANLDAHFQNVASHLVMAAARPASLEAMPDGCLERLQQSAAVHLPSAAPPEKRGVKLELPPTSADETRRSAALSQRRSAPLANRLSAREAVAWLLAAALVGLLLVNQLVPDQPAPEDPDRSMATDAREPDSVTAPPQDEENIIVDVPQTPEDAADTPDQSPDVQPPSESTIPSLNEQKRALLAEDGVLEWKWLPSEDPAALVATGSVVWSNERQEGFLTFQKLAANDPTREQYQLWIIDGQRDPAQPVDGGVFDIEQTDDEVIVRIDAKLQVFDPQAFAVTIEQPGGVVVSDRSRLPLLASRDAI